MTIKIGNQYVHTVLGYVDDDGITVITEDTELATMTGKYVDTSTEESTDPASYAWTEISSEEVEDEDSATEAEDEDADDTSTLLYRLANTQMTESVQGNLVTGTNQGADGWAADTGTIAAVECQPDDSGTTANGVEWAAPGGGQLSRSESIPGEAVPETVTVSFWWMASAQCGLMVSIGDNTAAAQYNHDNGDLDADGNALEMTGAWLFYKAMIPIRVTADAYAAQIKVDSAATIDLCNFKVERGDKATAWTASVDEAIADAKTAQETANQKTASYYQATAPTGGTYAVNDAWYDTANGGKMHYWNGTAWIPQLLQAKAIDVNSLFADVISTQSFNMEVIKNDAGFIGIQANYEDPDDPESSSKNTIDLSATTYASGTEDVKYSEITLDQNGDLTLHCTGNMQIISENNEIIVPGNGQKTYTSFDGSILSGGSIVVVKKIGWCQVFGYLKPSAPVTNFTQVLDAVKVPAPEHGANITPTVPSWYSASDLPARVRVQATGGLAIQGGTANREYNFSITYPIA